MSALHGQKEREMTKGNAPVIIFFFETPGMNVNFIRGVGVETKHIFFLKVLDATIGTFTHCEL